MRCKSLPKETTTLVTESNCVTVRLGGKQLEVKIQAVGDELDSAIYWGEPVVSLAKPENQHIRCV